MAGLVTQFGQEAAPTPCPPLRPDLSLYPGPTSEHGAPTWTLYDPAAYRFFRLGWLEFQILERWHLGTVEAVTQSVNQETPLTISEDQVKKVLLFAEGNNLLQGAAPSDTQRLAGSVAARKMSTTKWLLSSYLFFRITLVRPDRFLGRVLPYFSFVFSKGFLVAVLVTALMGLFLILRQWAVFRDSMSQMFTLQGAAMIGAALFVAKIVHEFGHGLAAKKLGCRVPAMGVAFMVFFPLLWTDTTDGWKLRHKRDRMLIDGAGVLAELALAALASLAWSLLPPGPLRTACYVMATTTWVMTLAVNASPFLRYDGYYFLSDLLDTPDLQTRAFAMGRWWLRRFLFRFSEPKPEAMSRARGRLLIWLALATWVYRFFLFLGIALLVYYFFFKALGLALMIIELAWFLGLPIYKELAYWRKRVGESGIRSLSWRAWLLLAGLLVLLFAPWQRHVSAPAMLRAERQNTLYCPRPARLENLLVANGQAVAQGEPIMVLASPDLDHHVAQNQRQVEVLTHRLSLLSLESELMQTLRRDQRELESVVADLEGMYLEQQELTLAAPFSGEVADIDDWLRPGVWIDEGEALAVVKGGAMRVDVFIQEQDLGRIEEGARGKFYATGGRVPPVDLVLASVDRSPVRDLDYPELASVYAGPLAVTQGRDTTLVPEQSLYRAVCEVDNAEGPPVRMVAGTVVLGAQPRSLASMIWRRAVGVFVRESGL